MAQEVAFEYTVRTRQNSDESYAILVEQAPGHWIAQIRLPDGTFWTMKRSEPKAPALPKRSEEHTSELQSRLHLVCRLLLEKKKKKSIRRKQASGATAQNT